ncbi:hypothetical protein [Methylobacterium sp. CM6247]
MFSLMLAAIGGGGVTALIVVPLSPALAIIAVPFGASLCAALAAIHIARERGCGWHSHIQLDEQTDADEQMDAMVASLHSVAVQAGLTVHEEMKPLNCNKSRIGPGVNAGILNLRSRT